MNPIRLALAQALIPEAKITIRGQHGRYTHTPDHRVLGRAVLLVVAVVVLIAAGLAFGVGVYR